MDVRKLLFRALAVSVAALLPLVALAAEPGDSLKLMSYNLRFGELSSMEDIAAFIKGETPDIVALQECDWDTHRTRAPHQNGVKFINELAYHSGMFGIYGKSIDYSGGYYGIGILSRYPIIRSERVLLPNDGKTEQRSMLIADIELPGGRVVTFVCTHLEVKSSEMRVKQARFIDRYLRKVRNPLFLCGDMNAEPDSPEMEYLRSGWTDLTDRELTFSTVKPQTKIDYIYSRGSDASLISTAVCRGVFLSDHFPVISTVILQQ